MNDPALFPVLALVGGGLVVATLIGAVLSWRQRRSTGEVSPTVRNLVQRVRAWWVMVGVLLVTSMLGSTSLFGLYALLSMLALRELVTLAPTHRADHRTLAAVFFVLVPLHYLFAAIGWYQMFLIAIPVYGFVAIPGMLALSGEPDRFLERTAKLLIAVLFAVYFVSYVPMLQHLDIDGVPANSPRLLFFLVFVTQASDVLQYVTGKLFGRRSLAPKVSPNKTVEGLVLGGGAAVLLGTALHGLTPFGPIGTASLSLVVVATGAVGGLVMSAAKRSLGAKDWGAAIEGHGGVLDRLDSLLFSAPLFFHLTVYYADLTVPSTRPPWLDALLQFAV